ncbi:MAG: hypothetical protein PHP50_06075 [Lachnospiraceae bacterium]|nr:hypothetical protein [Lachnospiraceae bacterium]
MKLFKKITDERENMEMMKVEHYGFYVMFTLSCLSLIWESYILELAPEYWTGEIIILLAGGLTVLIGCIKKGNWDYYSKPTTKNAFLYSLGAAILFTVFFGIGKYRNYEVVRNNITGLFLPMCAFMFVFLFVICFAIMELCIVLTKKKRAKMEAALKNEEDE